MSERRMILTAVLPVLLLARPAAADVLEVPSAEFPTIQSAVDAAVAGDTVRVSKGTYVEPLEVWDKQDIVLRAVGKVVIEATEFNTGITVGFCTGVEVRGFTISNAREHSLVVGCSDDVLVKKCRILGGDLDGIRVFSGTGCRFEGNVVKDVAQVGIRVQIVQPDEPGGPDISCFGPNGMVLVKNRVEGTGGDGIQVSGVSNILEKNRVIDVGGDGIVTLPDASQTVLRKNRVTGAGARGLVVQGADQSLEKNRIKKPVQVGLLVEDVADGVSLQGDRVIKSQVNGLELAASNLTASGLRALKSGAHGFVVGGSGSTLEDCRASDAWFDGFYVAASASNFTECSASQSGLLDLVDAAGASNTNTYVDCKFKTSNL